MGVIISAFVGIISCLAGGVMTAIIANKAGKGGDDCNTAKKWSIYTSIGQFVLAILIFIFALFL